MSSLSQTHNNMIKTAIQAEKTGTASLYACSSFAMQKRKKFALIDMGSNSFRLCIFDDFASGDAKKLKFVETCRLGEGFHDTLTIGAVPMARGLLACEKFLGICAENGVSDVLCFATAVVRESKNRDVFLAECEKLGLKIHVLSGDQEALCGFLGACKTEKDKSAICEDFNNAMPQAENCDTVKLTAKETADETAVFDIGGASFEIAIGSADNFKGLFFDRADMPTHGKVLEKASGENCGLSTFPLSYSHSFKLGAVRMTDMFSEDFASMQKYISQQFSLQCESVPLDFHETKCVGIGGTITSICGLVAGLENFNMKLHGYVCSQNEIIEKVENIKNMSVEERKNLPFLKEKRKEIIAGGGEILAIAMKQFSAQNITASLSDNLEGYREYLGI